MDSKLDKQSLISVQGLSIDFWNQVQWVHVLEDVTFHLKGGGSLGLVGESGCGKTTTAYALLGMRRPGSRVTAGQVLFDGKDLFSLPQKELEKIRGCHIGYVPQDPTTALSPAMRVGDQIVEILEEHRYISTRNEARERIIELFHLVNLPDPENMYRKYPHQLSGGQQQRVVIVMALACDPKLVVMDEPTTGLDVTTQAQILDLLKKLRMQLETTIIYVTHNLGVVAQICDHIGVMYAGRLVEISTIHDLFENPFHPYTQGLIASVPRLHGGTHQQISLMNGLLRRDELPEGCPFAPRCEFALQPCLKKTQTLREVNSTHWVSCWRQNEIPSYAARVHARNLEVESDVAQKRKSNQGILKVTDLRAGYGLAQRGLRRKRTPRVVVNGVTFEVKSGETMALVGESGSGKTTIAHALSGLVPYVDGQIEFEKDSEIEKPVEDRSSELLRLVQLVFQNPDSSLNPRQRIAEIIGRPLRKFFGISGKEARERIQQLLEDVHLDKSYYNRFPGELSGGERQRVALARALAAEPSLILCDEITSALDVSVQASILNLLSGLQERHGIALLFISHDLAVVRSLADTVAVLYWGSFCEIGSVEEVFSPPLHPYTSLLLKSVPEADPNYVIESVQSKTNRLSEAPEEGCPFAHRCDQSLWERCLKIKPPWRKVSKSHTIACHLELEQLWGDLPSLK